MIRAAIVLVVMALAGCATTRALEDTVTEIGRTAAQANTGIAAVSTRTQELLVTIRSEIAASSSGSLVVMEETGRFLATARAEIARNGSATAILSTRIAELVSTLRDGLRENAEAAKATTAAIASTTREFEALLAGLRPNLVAASAELAPVLVNVKDTLANTKEATAKISDRADDPLLSSESRWVLRIVGGAVALLLLHAVWSHLHLKKIIKSL